MAIPTTREEFKKYCLRKLGEPVIKINVSEEQVDDRVDEALSFWQEYHYNGSELMYLKHALTEEDIERGYIEAPSNLVGVTRILELGSSIMTGTGMFNITYQYVLNNISDMTAASIQNYWMTMQNIRFLQEWLVGLPMIRYNRHHNKIHLDISADRLNAGMFVVIEAYAPLDETNSDIWSDRWLQKYATVLIKEEWGEILSKFVGVQMMGGVAFNGEQIKNEARDERMRMEEDAIHNLQPIVMNFSG